MSKKDYKKGMADAVEAYKGFGEKQEAAIRHVGREVEKAAQKMDKLGGKIGEIADYITDQEKAALYKLNTPVDIADLEDAEKRILMAVLYQLSADADEVTEEQQNYVRAVQQYLKIYNPQTEIDLSAVENIEDISAQKAVLQSALEFFRLGVAPDELTEEQEDFLDYFQVNRRTRREIDGFIDAIVEVVGIRGLAEKYGFVAAQPQSEFAKYKDNGPIPEKVVDFCIKQRCTTKIETFQNGQFYLETRDYLICCISPQRGHNSTKEFPVGFYRIDKQTAKMEHINIDYVNVFPFNYVEYLSFFIQGNTIYFIENYLSGYSDRNPKLVAIDFAKKTARILPFNPPVNKYEKYFHLSGDASYLLLHIQGLNEHRDRVEWSNTYVIDLAQGERVFLLDAPMKWSIDAFLSDGKFYFLGKKGSDDYTIYQYDINSKTLTDISTEPNHNIWSALSDPRDYSFGRMTVEWMEKRNGKYYFLLTHNPYREEKKNEYYLRVVDPKDWTGESPFLFPSHSVLFYGDFIYSTKFGELYNLSTETLTKCNITGDGQMLLGDFLCGNECKANISKGWNNLQWEIMSFPE